MAKMTNKKLIELISFATILAMNNKHEDVITEEQLDKAMKMLKDSFDGSEDKAIKFIQSKVQKLVKDLENVEE